MATFINYIAHIETPHIYNEEAETVFNCEFDYGGEIMTFHELYTVVINEAKIDRDLAVPLLGEDKVKEIEECFVRAFQENEFDDQLEAEFDIAA